MEKLVEILDLTGPLAGILLALWAFINVITAIADARGKVAPVIINIRRLIRERKKAKQEQKQLFVDMKASFDEFNSHYSEDNITKRDEWMNWVNTRATVYDQAVSDLVDLKASNDRLSEFTCKMIKENYRNRILDFQHRIVNARGKTEPEYFSHEEFAKIYATYRDYEEFLEYTNDENHQVDDAMRTIRKAEAGELPNIVFIEDLR